MKKRGVALIWAMVLGMILLIISTSMANYVVREARMSTEIELSGGAISGAEAGISWATNCLDKNIDVDSNDVLDYCPLDTLKNLDLPSNIRAEVIITTDPSDSAKRIINSTGISNNVRRKIEYKYSKENLTVIAGKDSSQDPNIRGTISVPGNFEMSFYIWGGVSGTQIGLGDALGNGILYAKYIDQNTLALEVRKSNGDIISNPLNISGFSNNNEPQALKVKFEYYKNLAVKMMIGEDANGYACAISTYIDMSNDQFNNFNNFYFSPNVTMDTGEAYGDGLVYNFGNQPSNSAGRFDTLAVKGINVLPGGEPLDILFCLGKDGNISKFFSHKGLPGYNWTSISSISFTPFAVSKRGNEYFSIDSTGKLYKKVNNSWIDLNSTNNQSSFIGMSTNGNDLFAVGYFGRLYKHTGISDSAWVEVPTQSAPRAIEIFFTNGNNVVAATIGGDMYSHTGVDNTSWVSIGTNSGAPNTGFKKMITMNGSIYGVNDNGLLYKKAVTDWISISSNTLGSSVVGLSAYGNEIFATTGNQLKKHTGIANEPWIYVETNQSNISDIKLFP